MTLGEHVQFSPTAAFCSHDAPFRMLISLGGLSVCFQMPHSCRTACTDTVIPSLWFLPSQTQTVALRRRFILKTDDDAFVNVPAFVQQLRMLCESPDCRHERLYMGKQCRRGKVILSPGHKWDNGAYYNHTGACLQPCCDLHAASAFKTHLSFP